MLRIMGDIQRASSPHETNSGFNFGAFASSQLTSLHYFGGYPSPLESVEGNWVAIAKREKLLKTEPQLT